jgi:hypothetical protein
MLMEAGGGGSISVDSAALETMSARISGVGGSTLSVRGSLTGAAGAADGCQDPAAGAFKLMQSMMTGALSCLDSCSTTLSRATCNASGAYVTTDVTQMPMTIEGCPAAP